MGNMLPSIYAPVMIPTLCRYEHFKACVESLSKCTGADKTDLFIGLDYPKNDIHRDGYNKICEYIEQIHGFKNVFVIRHKENVGVAKNNQSLRDVIFPKYDRYIYSEDDNVFSPNFLIYINQGLEIYRDNPKVAAITGFSLSQHFGDTMKDYPYNIFPYQRFYAWGFGTWVNQYKEVENMLTPEGVSKILGSWAIVKKCFSRGFYITIHRLIKRNMAAFGDLVWAIYCIINDKYCIVPSLTKVNNNGFDGSGLNCASWTASYAKQDIDTNMLFSYDDIEIKDYLQVQNMHRKTFYPNKKFKYFICLEYFIFKWLGIKIADNDVFRSYTIKRMNPQKARI